MKTILSYETVSGLKINFFKKKKKKMIRVWVEYHFILPTFYVEMQAPFQYCSGVSYVW